MKSITTTYFLENKELIQRIQKDFLYSIEIVEKMLDTKFDNLILMVSDTKSHYDSLLRTSRPPWGVSTHKKGVIYIYNPSLWKKTITGHTIKDLIPSLIHELVHVHFFQKHLTSPIWFEEGLAVKLSDENKGNKQKAFYQLASKYPIPDIIKVTQNFKKLKGKLPLMYYLTFFMFTSYLFDQFQTKKIILFIKLLDKEHNFEWLFNEVFGHPLQKVWIEFMKEMQPNND